MPEFVKIILTVLGSIIGLVLSLFITYVLVLAISSLFVDTKRIYDKHSKYYRALVNSFTVLIRIFLRIKIHTKGMEKLENTLPKGSRFLLVQNHRSNFDPILTWLILMKYDVAFISKEANMHIPIFGRLIRKCCFMAIDRENAREAIKTIIKASEIIKDDQVSYGIYPEGSRNKEYKGLLPFHNGVFKIAQLAKVPIVVTTIRGTEDVHRNFPKRHTDVYFEVTSVILPENIVKTSTKEIGAEVEKQMLLSLGELEG